MKFMTLCFLLGIFVFCFFVNGSYSEQDVLKGNGWKLGKLKNYLKENGYSGESGGKLHPSELKAAITKLKILYKFDDSVDISRIFDFIEKPRCGVPDMKSSQGFSQRKRRYNVYAPWRRTTLTYMFKNYHSKLSSSDQERIVGDAFKLWKNAVPALSFTKTTSSNADIKLSFVKLKHADCLFPFDGKGSKIGHAYFPESGEIHFDDDEDFTDKIDDGVNLYTTAIHEIGHALGLEHSFKGTSLMHPIYHGYNPHIKLDPDDVAAITALYDPVQSPHAACVDEDPVLCGPYKSAGYCTDMADVMKEVCPATCNLC